MATSRLPEFIDALVTQGRTALADEEVLVLDGYDVTGDPSDFVMIGVENPDLAEAAFSGAGTQVAATMGTARKRDEDGSVTCAAYSWNGDCNQKAARDAVFGYMAAFETLLRADPSFSIDAGGLFVGQLGEWRLSQNQNEDGADALLIFTIRYRARL